jgi:hypothetical protein
MTGSKVPIGQDVNGRLVRSTVERGEHLGFDASRADADALD